MRFVLAGGSGQIGALVVRWLHRRGDAAVVLTRRPRPDAGVRQVEWDACTLGPWRTELDGADVLINLAGRSVNCRYSPANREAIKRSRVDSTRILGAALAASSRPPRLWLQSSTATIYAHRYDAPNDEATGILGGDEPGAPDTWRFSIDVARSWEHAAGESAPSATRLVKMRSAMVMSPDPGGVFATLLGLVRAGLGGASGDGRQFVSWIHEHDFVRAIEWLVDREHLDGAVNLAAPHPLPNAVFMRGLREAWGTRIGLPASRWMLELGAIALRTETELVLKSRRVIPGRLLSDGFVFEYPHWSAAAAELCARWRAPVERPRHE